MSSVILTLKFRLHSICKTSGILFVSNLVQKLTLFLFNEELQCRLTTDTRLYLVVTPILVFCSESASFHLIQWLLGPPGWLYQFLTCLWRNVRTTGCRHSFIHLFLKVQPHFGAQRSLECFVLVSNLCQCWLMGSSRAIPGASLRSLLMSFLRAPD